MGVALSNSASETEDVEGLDTEDEYSDDESSFGTKSNHVLAVLDPSNRQTWTNLIQKI